MVDGTPTARFNGRKLDRYILINQISKSPALLLYEMHHKVLNS